MCLFSSYKSEHHAPHITWRGSSCVTSALLPQALQEKLWNMAVPLCPKQNVTATAAAQQVSTAMRWLYHSCAVIWITLNEWCCGAFADPGGDLQAGVSVLWAGEQAGGHHTSRPPAGQSPAAGPDCSHQARVGIHTEHTMWMACAHTHTQRHSVYMCLSTVLRFDPLISSCEKFLQDVESFQR